MYLQNEKYIKERTYPFVIGEVLRSWQLFINILLENSEFIS